MKIFILFLGFITIYYTFSTFKYLNPRIPALPCDRDICQLPDCSCSNSTPNINKSDIPQIVYLRFPDTVNNETVPFFTEILNDRKNPNGCSISATFSVRHEFNDYSLVHELYSKGHEFILNTITGVGSNPTVDYLMEQFCGQRRLISHFANISYDDIKGVDPPWNLNDQDNLFETIQRCELLYSAPISVWGPVEFTIFWPYTLEFLIRENCNIEDCPTRSFPNLWEIPSDVWTDEDGIPCSYIDACVYLPNSTDDILEWMKREFNKHYHGFKDPFIVNVRTAWFHQYDLNYEAFLLFLDYLGTLSDVFILNSSQIIEWFKNQKPIAEMIDFPCSKTFNPTCDIMECDLIKDDNITHRTFTACMTECPNSYPWVGNPLGE